MCSRCTQPGAMGGAACRAWRRGEPKRPDRRGGSAGRAGEAKRWSDGLRQEQRCYDYGTRAFALTTGERLSARPPRRPHADWHGEEGSEPTTP